MDWKMIVVEIDGARFGLTPLDKPTTRTSLGSLNDLKLISTLARKALENDGIEYLEQVLERTEAELLRIPSFGRKGLNEIRDAVAAQWAHLRVGQFKKE